MSPLKVVGDLWSPAAKAAAWAEVLPELGVYCQGLYRDSHVHIQKKNIYI